MASANGANQNSSNVGAREQLLVCWLEPQSDAGKVSAIPAAWIAQVVSGDGRSANSIVRCRWPRTKRLYRARIVTNDTNSSPAQSGAVQAHQKGKEENSDDLEPQNSSEDIHQHQQTFENDDEEYLEQDSPTSSPSNFVEKSQLQNQQHQSNMVKEEPASVASKNVSNRSTQQQQIMNNNLNTPTHSAAQMTPNNANAASVDAASLAQALLPTLKKLFNSELNRLSTDIQANFDIIGHKISALDGTVKCIKTRVDRMETLLNTAAQELGDNQTTSTPMSTLASGNNLHSSQGSSDLLAGAARTLNMSNGGQNLAGSTMARRPTVAAATANTNGNGGTATSTSIAKNNFARQAVSQPIRRPPVGNFGRNLPQQQTNAQRTPPAVSFVNRPQINTGSFLASRSQPTSTNVTPGSTSSSSSKRRRSAATTNPPLPKAAVISAPNGFEIYLGGDKTYKMPLVMYKDALKNCTRPSATYMVMALIRRYLTPDEMSRTWLTEQQLLGKKDGVLLDQNLLTALKKQGLMQFPGSGIDDRLLIRKLYDVFHGIRRQMRKKRREAGLSEQDLLEQYGADGGAAFGANDMGGADGESGSGADEHEDVGMDDDAHHLDGQGDIEQGFNNFDGNDDFEDDEHNDAMMNAGEGGGAETGDDDGLMGDEGVLNGDEDLEEMAAKRAAFWTGADETY